MKHLFTYSISVLSLFFGSISAAFAQGRTFCKVNGREIPCDQFTEAVGMPFLILWGFFVLLLIALFVFWIMMLVHVIRHPIQNKPLWILVILIGQGLGAIVYYFAVKRKMSEHVAAPVVTPPSAPPAA